MEKLDPKRISEYNEKLKAHQEKAAKLKASVEIMTEQLERDCKQLSEALGTEVTPDNLEAVYQQYMEKVENTLSAGEDLLRQFEMRSNPQVAANTAPTVGFVEPVGVPGAPQGFNPQPGGFTATPPVNMTQAQPTIPSFNQPVGSMFNI